MGVGVDTGIAVDDKQEIKCRAMPSLKASEVLAPERFSMTFSSVICGVCLHVANEAIQVPCCSKVTCFPCVWHWLEQSATCPMCRVPLMASSLPEVPVFVYECISELAVKCDFHASVFEGCQKTLPLGSLKDHVADCTFGKFSTAPYVPLSATVADVLTASPRKLCGDAAERLTSHLVAAKANDGILQVRQSAKGPPQTFTRTTQGRIGSDTASTRTVQRRASELQQHKTTVCGSASSSHAQDAAELRSLSKEKRQQLLKDAGVGCLSLSASAALSLQTDLNMPWNQLRKLRRWMHSYGLSIESEHKMREQVVEQLPSDFIVENVPFLTRNGEVLQAPMVASADLVKLVHFYLDEYNKAGLLTWHNESLPGNEVLVKVGGGDHGGGGGGGILQNVFSNSKPIESKFYEEHHSVLSFCSKGHSCKSHNCTDTICTTNKPVTHIRVARQENEGNTVW